LWGISFVREFGLAPRKAREMGQSKGLSRREIEDLPEA
jgi:hypothetical protein